MPRYLYPDFLSCPTQYVKAEKFWSDMCEEILAKQGQKGEWVQWLNTTTKEGNPIFSLFSTKQNKGFSIIQESIENRDHVYIYARTLTFGENYYPRPIEQLLIGCELSEESAMIAEKLIEHWTAERTNMHTMTFFIDQVL